MTTKAPRRRSGCATVTGFLLILVGGVFLAYNLAGQFGFPPIRVVAQAVAWFGTYWPAIFILWGIVKVVNRVVRPERASVGPLEVFVLGLVLIVGLSVSGARRAMEELSIHVTLDDVAGLVGPDLLGPRHRFESESRLDAGSARSLRVTGGRGRITVTGTDDREVHVVLVKRVHDLSEDSARSAADQVTLDLAADGELTRVTVQRAEAPSVQTDLELRVPRALTVFVENDRGNVELSALTGAARVETSYGRVDATDLSGGVDVTTSHGDIRLRRVGGDTRANNRSGGVSASGVDGDLDIRSSGGRIVVDDVAGSLHVETRNGSVGVMGVEGAVEISARYAEVSVERVGADVTIGTNNRPVFVDDVTGSVSVTGRNSNVTLRRIGRDVTVENQYRPVLVADVSGRATINARQSVVDVDGAGGPVVIESSHEDIRVTRFDASLEIRSSHADLDVAAVSLAGPVTLVTTYGDVRLALPENAGAQLTAATEDGSIESALSAVEPEEVGSSSRRELRTTLGDGTHAVSVQTSYGDISLPKVAP